MFQFKVTVVFIPFLFIGLAECADFKCPAFSKLTEDTLLFMDGNQCDIYWACTKGEPKRNRCPDGLVFHPDKSKGEDPCDLKHNVPDKCKKRPNQQRPKPGDAHCPRQNGVYPSEDLSECDVFYSCLNGKGSSTRCAEGLHFSTDLGTCVWPRESGRDGCLSATERRKNKPESKTNTPTTAKPQTLSNGFRCPGGALGVHPLLPHPTSCRQYYICLNGVEATEYGCGQGQVFNPDVKKCDQPRNVLGCEDFYDEKAKARKVELASAVGTSVDSKEFSKFLKLLKDTGVLAGSGPAKEPGFYQDNRNRPGKTGGPLRRKPGRRNGGRRKGPRQNRRRPRPNKPRPVYYDYEEDYDIYDDYQDEEDIKVDAESLEEVDDEILDNDQDNEILDPAFNDKIKKNIPELPKSAPLTRFSSNRNTALIDRFRPRLSGAEKTVNEKTSTPLPNIIETTQTSKQTTDDVLLSNDEAAALFSSLLQDTLETAPVASDAGISLIQSSRTESPIEPELEVTQIKEEISEKPSRLRSNLFRPRTPAVGRRPFSRNRPSGLETATVESEETTTSTTTTEQPATTQAFIPTPISKGSRKRPAFPRIGGNRIFGTTPVIVHQQSTEDTLELDSQEKESNDRTISDSSQLRNFPTLAGRKEDILAKVPRVENSEVLLTTINDATAQTNTPVTVTESLIMKIPMVHRNTIPEIINTDTESPLLPPSPSVTPFRQRFNFQGSRESSSDSLDEEVNSSSPAELPRSLNSDSEEVSQNQVISSSRPSRLPLPVRRRGPSFVQKNIGGRREPSFVHKNIEATLDQTETDIIEENISVTEESVEPVEFRRPSRTRTRLPTPLRTSPSSGTRTALTRPSRRRGEIVRATTTERVDESQDTSEQEIEVETATEAEIRTRIRTPVRTRTRQPVQRPQNEALETNIGSIEEDSTSVVRPVPRRLIHRRPSSNDQETNSRHSSNEAQSPARKPVARRPLPETPLITHPEPAIRKQALSDSIHDRSNARTAISIPGREPVSIPGREPVSIPSREPVLTTMREPVSLPIRSPNPSAIQSERPLNETPRFLSRQQPAPRGDIKIEQASSPGGRGVTDIFSGTGGVAALPFSTGRGTVQQQAALTPAFQELTPFQQLTPDRQPQLTPFEQLTPASRTSQPFQALTPVSSSAFQTPFTPATQAPVNLPPINVPGQVSSRIPIGFGNFQSFQIFQGPGQAAPVNQVTGQIAPVNQLTGQAAQVTAQRSPVQASLQLSSENSAVFTRPQFSSGSTFSTFNFGSGQQTASRQQTLSPFQAALTKLPSGALPSFPVGGQITASSNLAATTSGFPQSRNSIPNSGTEQQSNSLPISPEQAEIRKMVSARIRSHLKELLAENEGDAVEQLREKVDLSQNINRARG